MILCFKKYHIYLIDVEMWTIISTGVLSNILFLKTIFKWSLVKCSIYPKKIETCEWSGIIGNNKSCKITKS